MHRLSVLLAILALVWLDARSSDARTWRVEHDPDIPADQIGQVVLAAGLGDTILIGPGTYTEHIPFDGKSLTLIGEAGTSSTILDGATEIPGRDLGIFYSRTPVPTTLVLQGMTLRNGRGSLDGDGQRGGGAICFWNGGDAGGLFVRECVFEDNVAETQLGMGGGAIAVYIVPTIEIRNCSFVRCRTNGRGGALALYGGGTEFRTEIVGCSFEADAAFDGVALYLIGAATWIVHENRFSSSVLEERDCVVAYVTHLDFTRNTLLSPGGSLASRIRISYSGFGDIYQEVTFADNLVVSARSASPEVRIYIPHGAVSIRGNTIVSSTMQVELYEGEPLAFTNNILYHSPAALYGAVGGEALCNDAWPDSIFDGLGTLGIEDNLSVDPLFCDETGGDYRLAGNSECAEENNPFACGRVGVFGVACPGVAVRETSWGTLKYLYGRGERSGSR